MEERIITEDMLLRYRKYLEEEEKSRNTKLWICFAHSCRREP